MYSPPPWSVYIFHHTGIVDSSKLSHNRLLLFYIVRGHILYHSTWFYNCVHDSRPILYTCNELS